VGYRSVWVRFPEGAYRRILDRSHRAAGWNPAVRRRGARGGAVCGARTSVRRTVPAKGVFGVPGPWIAATVLRDGIPRSEGGERAAAPFLHHAESSADSQCVQILNGLFVGDPLKKYPKPHVATSPPGSRIVALSRPAVARFVFPLDSPPRERGDRDLPPISPPKRKSPARFRRRGR